jgi:hypothetical protein
LEYVARDAWQKLDTSGSASGVSLSVSSPFRTANQHHPTILSRIFRIWARRCSSPAHSSALAAPLCMLVLILIVSLLSKKSPEGRDSASCGCPSTTLNKRQTSSTLFFLGVQLVYCLSTSGNCRPPFRCISFGHLDTNLASLWQHVVH